MTVLRVHHVRTRGSESPDFVLHRIFFIRCYGCGKTFSTTAPMGATLCADCRPVELLLPEMYEPKPCPEFTVVGGHPIDFTRLAVGTYRCPEHGLCPEGSDECGVEGCESKAYRVSRWSRGHYEGRRDEREEFWGSLS